MLHHLILFSFFIYKVSQSERETVDRLEMVYVWGPELDLADVQKFFSPYHPLSVDQVGRTACHVTWATSVNAARAMLGLSKGIGIASTERVVKHVLGAGSTFLNSSAPVSSLSRSGMSICICCLTLTGVSVSSIPSSESSPSSIVSSVPRDSGAVTAAAIITICNLSNH